MADGQERFVFVATGDPGNTAETTAPVGFWRTSWRQLRHRPKFVVAVALIAVMVMMAAFPRLFTGVDPTRADPSQSLLPPSSQHWFGTDLQGHDIYARTVYGARASITVGIATTVAVLLIGTTLGALAGFYGGWLDGWVSRLADVVFSVPLLLAAIVLAQVLPRRGVLTVVVALAVFGWPQLARVTRAAVLEARRRDYVIAAYAMGLGRFRTLLHHVLPNALGPVIVVTTISLGSFIVTEATLSYLGVGLPPTTVSWGEDINLGQSRLRAGSPIVFYPAGALALTVLAFMMLGDVLREALDPGAHSMRRRRFGRR
ncbi:MAG: ABC transporter permease [Mycobacterium sp.]|uniref:ABC transporter permease n=1 Tax=Mycobacterium sp. TaxID=1785 RepID=UPI0026051D06|nr:ABC transporter permease [Mycobacterium sp.]MDI3313517.1 ABC transporter permease [Mycobacterium sp.]